MCHQDSNQPAEGEASAEGEACSEEGMEGEEDRQKRLKLERAEQRETKRLKMEQLGNHLMNNSADGYPRLEMLDSEIWNSALAPALSLAALVRCQSVCSGTKSNISLETVFEIHFKPRWGRPSNTPANWQKLCHRLFLRSVTIQIDISNTAKNTQMNSRVPVELKSRIGVPPVDFDGVLNDQYAVILE